VAALEHGGDELTVEADGGQQVDVELELPVGVAEGEGAGAADLSATLETNRSTPPSNSRARSASWLTERGSEASVSITGNG